MCGRVTVTADDGGAWQREALFRPNDMYDTLSLVVETKVREIEGLDVVLQSYTLRTRVSLFDKFVGCSERFPRCGRDVLCA